MSGLYIHIPFCASRCIYCGFYSTITPKKAIGTGEVGNGAPYLIDRYTDAICKEMELQKGYIVNKAIANEENSKLKTIYLGGGTPSQLSFRNLQQIFHQITTVYGEILDDYYSMEVTLECNPDDVTDDFASEISRLPINRISMGVQTFSNDRLRFIKRRHNTEEIGMAVRRLRNIGIQNISIDLMFGFPQENLDDWKKDIDKALALNIEHISAYSLMYEEGTPLFHLLECGKVKEIDEDSYRKMYEELTNRLTNAGFEQYEISNFARIIEGRSTSPYRSRHNSSYWNDTAYLGIGASAHSYNRTSRQWNVSDLKVYIDAIEKGKLPAEKEIIDENTHYNDLITTALRTTEGIDTSVLPSKLRKYILKAAQPHIEANLLKIDDNHLHLTRNGIFVSDSIMSDLMFV